MKDKVLEEGNIMPGFSDGSLGHRENMSLIRITEALSRGVGWTLLCLIPLPRFIKYVHPCLAVKKRGCTKKGCQHHTSPSKHLRVAYCVGKAYSAEYFLLLIMMSNAGLIATEDQVVLCHTIQFVHLVLPAGAMLLQLLHARQESCLWSSFQGTLLPNQTQHVGYGRSSSETSDGWTRLRKIKESPKLLLLLRLHLTQATTTSLPSKFWLFYAGLAKMWFIFKVYSYLISRVFFLGGWLDCISPSC